VLPGLKDASGGLALFVRRESPGMVKESNWLPASNGPFWTVLRLYRPKDEALTWVWKSPVVKRSS
jgi:hypothetical protein